MAEAKTLRLGTRGSLLARSQSRWVADALEKMYSGLRVELVIIKTTGDKIMNRPLYEAGGKGLFTKELEEALLKGQVDFAVHSFKDVPVTMPLVDTSGLIFAAVPKREDPRDVLVSLKAKGIMDLRRGAKVGTSSLRRRAQLLEKRPDLAVEPIRGNIDTRLRKLKEGEFDATILALAGLKRSGLFDKSWMSPLEFDEMLPAPAQGALALQCRRKDGRVKGYLTGLNHQYTYHCIYAERGLVQRLEGDCHSPIAALAEFKKGQLHLRAAVAGRDGSTPVVRASHVGTVIDVNYLVERVYGTLAEQGVQALLAGRR